LPTVYQGNYSAVARIPEKDLFPLLRKLNFSFYAYSPLAGGLLTKSAQEIKDGAGRFGEAIGGLYRSLYHKPKYMEALSEWERTANEEGVGRAELGYRWVTFHSQMDLTGKYGDALVIGGRPQQLDDTIEYTKKGPLSDKAVERINHIWDLVKNEAPVDNFNK
jgi:aflatoxin B1 aldehyde reductase